MCGFVGGFGSGITRGIELDRALESIRHRGPDDTGRWVANDDAWFLGHTRLSIIGLTNGDQPMSGADGQVRMVVNGEFYDYKRIREELRAEGFTFTTDSDSEIALHLYLKEGMSMCDHLRGEFAVLIADRRNNAMLAIRDRFGIKPLFYTVHNGQVYFASEVKALLALGIPARWNLEAVMMESYHFRPNSRSLFDGIYSVPPGHYAVAQRGEVSLYPYWDIDFPTAEELSKDTRSDEEVTAGFRAVLDDAVQQRLVADVEVASYLSGGIDSCAVLGLAQQHMDRPIRAFTLAFNDPMFDESALAEEQAAFCGANYHPVPVTSQMLAGSYSDAVFQAETCFVNAHGVAKYHLSRAVRDAGIKVVFTGEGADEMLGGYAPFRRDVLLYNSETQDPDTVARLLEDMRTSNQAVPALVATEDAPLLEVAPVIRRLGWLPSWIHAFSMMGNKTTALFRPEMTEHVAGVNPYEIALNRLPIRERLTGRDPLNQALYLWTRVQLHNFILTFLSDRMEMAHSVEGRVPFLDHKVAEFCTHVPIRMKINGMREKHVLREATKDVLIPAVYDREKHPFTTPPAKAGENDALYELFADTLASQTFEEQPIFDTAQVRALFETIPTLPQEERIRLDGMLNRVVSLTLMHERFGMVG